MGGESSELSLTERLLIENRRLNEEIQDLALALDAEEYYSGAMYDLFREFGVDPQGRPALHVLRDLLARAEAANKERWFGPERLALTDEDKAEIDGAYEESARCQRESWAAAQTDVVGDHG